MRLRSLIKNQVLSIDDHKWGCQEEKKWDFKHCDIHVDKRTNFPINGKISAYSGGYPFSISGDIRSVPS